MEKSMESALKMIRRQTAKDLGNLDQALKFARLMQVERQRIILATAKYAKK